MGRYDALLQEEVTPSPQPPAEQAPFGTNRTPENTLPAVGGNSGQVLERQATQSPAPKVRSPQSAPDLATAPTDPLEDSLPAGGDMNVTSQVPAPVQKGGPSEIKAKKQQASNDASTLASYPDGLVDSIRKIVKSVGKEVSFVRLTPEEKNQLVDIVYTYKRQGVKTSENEINRIAVNLLLADYKSNGAASMLARVIEALLA